MRKKIFDSDFSFLERFVEKVNRYLTKSHDHVLKKVVLFEAVNYAKKNLPGSDESSMEPYLSSVKGSYHGLRHEVGVRLQGGIQKALGAVNVTTSNQKIEAKRVTIKELEDRKSNFMIDRDRIRPEYDHSAFQKNRPLLLVFAISEILWTISAFLKIGDIMVVAVLVGLGIGVAQISAIKTYVLMIKEIDDRHKKRSHVITAAAASVVFSLLIALLRYWFIFKLTGNSVPFIVINPFIFAAVNLLFITATGLLVYFFFPSKEELKKLDEIKKINKEIERITLDHKKLETELDMLLNERALLTELRIRIQHAEKALSERIDGLYEEAVGVFKNENTIKRTDGLFPVSFKRPHESLGKTGFENLLFT